MLKLSQQIKIIGTESLGVRGMCCLIITGDRQVLIDPGIALGYQRHGLLPHPCQVARGVKIREDILNAMKIATDIVFSHFHGDHVPLLHANPYQLSFGQISDRLDGLRIWAKSQDNFLPRMHCRALDLAELSGTNMKTADGIKEGPLSFSRPVPHGLAERRFGTVMMTRIDMGEQVFVHASDIQLLDDIIIDKILFWQPDILFVSGPPLYLKVMTNTLQTKAWENGLRLARNIDTLIVDHHLLRSEQGIIWLDNMSQVAGKKVYCAADFMNKPQLLFEAKRKELYQKMPVPENWHQDYEAGRISIEKVVDYYNNPL